MNPPTKATCKVSIKILLFPHSKQCSEDAKIFQETGKGGQRQVETERDINKQIVNPPCLYHPTPFFLLFLPKSNSRWHKKEESLF